MISSNFLMKNKDAMLDLLFLDTLRGKDSTGIAAIRSNGDVDSYKRCYPGYEFIEDNKAKDTMKLTDRLWMGHNRFKTVGLTSRLNAHPFTVFDEDDERIYTFVGAHNGTLKNKFDFDPKNEFGTDSEALIDTIAKVGVKEGIAKADGAWALSMYDAVENQLLLIRNKERPLWYVHTKDRKTVIWASEAWMIRAACGRRDIDLGEEKIHGLTENHLYTFEVPTKLNEEIPEPKKEGGFDGKPEPVKETFQGKRWTAWGGWGEDDEEGAKSFSSSKPQTPPATQTGKAVNHFNPLKAGQIRGFNNEPVDVNVAHLLMDNGCDWCGERIFHNSPMAWLDHASVCCQKCLNDTHKTPLILTAQQKESLKKVNEEKNKRAASKVNVEQAARHSVG